MTTESTTIERQERARLDLGLVGVWRMDEGYQVTELLFRSDGKYQLDLHSTNPELPYASSDPGEYSVDGNRLTLTPYEYFGEPYKKQFALAIRGGARFNTVGEQDRTVTVGASVAPRAGLFIEGYAAAGGELDEHGWGVAARVSF